MLLTHSTREDQLPQHLAHFRPRNCDRINSYCFQPPGLRSLVMVALGNSSPENTFRALWAGPRPWWGEVAHPTSGSPSKWHTIAAGCGHRVGPTSRGNAARQPEAKPFYFLLNEFIFKIF